MKQRVGPSNACNKASSSRIFFVFCASEKLVPYLASQSKEKIYAYKNDIFQEILGEKLQKWLKN